MPWLFLLIGLMVGGFIGMTVFCLCAVSGAESRREERYFKE